jgi:acetyl-CoA carboxylase biotin carboxyl carrier protein
VIETLSGSLNLVVNLSYDRTKRYFYLRRGVLMLRVQEIRELIKLIDQSSIEEFVFESEGSKIEMKKGSAINVEQRTEQIVSSTPAAAPTQSATPVLASVQTESTTVPTMDENLHKIVSPMVGTFYQSSSPDAEVFVSVGSKVSSNSVVCIVEAMKLFNEIEAEVDGEIVEILVKDGELVEYGQPLFLVKVL